jgi:hypothetical protein
VCPRRQHSTGDNARVAEATRMTCFGFDTDDAKVF